jgi:hypothetical protein
MIHDIKAFENFLEHVLLRKFIDLEYHVRAGEVITEIEVNLPKKDLWLDAEIETEVIHQAGIDPYLANAGKKIFKEFFNEFKYVEV